MSRASGRPRRGANSGRNVMISRTRRVATRSTMRSNRSSEVGSIQCTSSNTISTGWRAASPSSWASRGLKRLLLALLRSEAERWIAVADRYRQQVRDQRDGLAEVSVCLRQHRLELVQPLLGRVLTPESGCPLELC